MKLTKNHLGKFQVIQNSQGFANIINLKTQELMHSGCDPLPQAEKLYIDQTHLKEIILNSVTPIAVWDVGLGGGVNATAAINLARSLKRKINVISFEIDLDPLILVQENIAAFPNPGKKALDAILNNKSWSEEFVEWQLFYGDFLKTIHNAPKPEVIFWDPFSLKTDSPMWLGRTFELLTQRAFSDNVILSTYSSATRFRAALLSLGWWVAKGAPVSERTESTIAGGESMFKKLSIQPLGSEWIKKFKTSSAQFPSDWQENSKRINSVLTHKQFLV